MGRLFMEALDDPFARLEELLQQFRLGIDAAAIIVDFHAEASSEKMALAHFADGRVSGVLGSHCHVPTADNQILPGGTAYQTDAGMCGDYDAAFFSKPIIITASREQSNPCGLAAASRPICRSARAVWVPQCCHIGLLAAD
jgi:calcineurin-like phosphoesterase